MRTRRTNYFGFLFVRHEREELGRIAETGRLSQTATLRALIQELEKGYEDNRTLGNLSAEQTSAVRQLFSRKISVLRRRSYLPDILINFSVGAFFFALGILVTLYLGK